MPPPDRRNFPSPMLDIEALTAELERVGLDWADKKAAAEALDDATKSVLGAALLRADGKTVPERDAHARNDDEFKRHLGAVERARRAAYAAQVRWEVAKVRVELTRSNSATERALATLR
jgi:hypothetical protein